MRHRQVIRYFVFFAVFTLAAASASCSGLGFYTHNIHGHLTIMSQRQPIDEIVRDPSADGELKRRLLLSQEIVRFAKESILLDAHGGYLDYVALKTPYIKWNVIAAPQLSVKPKLWCFPIAGCVSYRGYYSEKLARRYAAKMARDGLETHISGAIAYSTLGWFNDPVLSSMLRWSDLRMAEFLFHELAHLKLFVESDQEFNEAFATTVADYGVKKWSAAHRQDQALEEFLTNKNKEQSFIRLALETRAKLAEVYDSDRSDDSKRLAKVRILTEMRATYQILREKDEIVSADLWFENVNNAKLAALASYQRFVPAFYAILEQERGDLRRFYQRVRKLGYLAKENRHAELEHLLQVSPSFTSGR